MEDISRELEREIALAKPKPFKQNRKKRVLIVDDFGEMKSGEHLGLTVKVLSVFSGVCFVAAVILFFLYTGLSRNTASVFDRLSTAEQKVAELTKDKEVLMAKLVITGNASRIMDSEAEPFSEDGPAVGGEKTPLVSKNQDIKSKMPEPGISEPDEASMPSGASDTPEAAKAALDEAPAGPDAETTTQPHVIKKTVSIEKFTVTKDGDNGDLLVRFDIRNISTEPGDVSGRIFTLLKPDNESEDQWLVVPSVALKDGVPAEHRKGQYFSIAHFKPVKFRIKNQAGPDFFKKASIFIFNNQGDLIFQKLIDITEAE